MCCRHAHFQGYCLSHQVESSIEYATNKANQSEAKLGRLSQLKGLWARGRAGTGQSQLSMGYFTYTLTFYGDVIVEGNRSTVNPYAHEQKMQTPHSEVWPEPEPVCEAPMLIAEPTCCPRKSSSAVPVAPKKLFMSRYRAGVTSSSGMSFSSTSSCSIVSSGPLSSLPVATGSVSPLATTTGTAPGTAPGGSDIGERLAALMNRGLPPSPPPARESAPTGGEASSSTRRSGRGRGKGRGEIK